jgi:hypothetical protein
MCSCAHRTLVPPVVGAVGVSDFVVLELLRIKATDLETVMKIRQKFRELDSRRQGELSRQEVTDRLLAPPMTTDEARQLPGIVSPSRRVLKPQHSYWL